jgi:tRNA threonylcarbamoyladenosine biosynthesis protein TsaE
MTLVGSDHVAADTDAMVALGRAFADELRPGDVVILDGPLGAGKTTFTRGIGEGLGVRGAVTSPTYVIARVHPGGRVPLVHVDAYRLQGIDELDDLDLEADLDDAVTIIEWGAGMAERLTPARLRVAFTRADDSDERRVSITREGPARSADAARSTRQDVSGTP